MRGQTGERAVDYARSQVLGGRQAKIIGRKTVNDFDSGVCISAWSALHGSVVSGAIRTDRGRLAFLI